MQRQAAFEKPEAALKGALHSHTTRSDGKEQPGDVVRKYASNGFDFAAITDHRIYNYRNFAPESGIIIVPGMEIDRLFYGDGDRHCFHTVCIGPSEADGNGYVQDQRFENGYVTDQFEFQKVLNSHHANNNMTIYCHPEWSGTPARDFERLSGNFAMEIWNTGCAMENEMDTNAAYWDELLMRNNRIYGVATDDGHNARQQCGGWVIVNAKRELNAILAALKQGAFYSSCGPEIHDFYVDNGTAVVECSPCAQIAFRYGRAPIKVQTAPDGLISRAEFKVPPYFKYLRVQVKDESGRRAWTNPIFF